MVALWTMNSCHRLPEEFIGVVTEAADAAKADDKNGKSWDWQVRLESKHLLAA